MTFDVCRCFLCVPGFRGKAKNCYRVAKPRVQKALQHAYVDRKRKKRDFSRLWVQQINAGARQHGIGYSRLVHGLTQADVQLNRRSLAALAQTEPESFEALVQLAQQQLKQKWGNLHTPSQTLAL
jgi:large subunit ribosomal protein L20